MVRLSPVSEVLTALATSSNRVANLIISLFSAANSGVSVFSPVVMFFSKNRISTISMVLSVDVVTRLRPA